MPLSPPGRGELCPARRRCHLPGTQTRALSPPGPAVPPASPQRSSPLSPRGQRRPGLSPPWARASSPGAAGAAPRAGPGREGTEGPARAGRAP